MERETKEFLTQNGNKAVIKTYLTYGEWRDIQSVIIGNLTMNVSEEGKSEIQGFNAQKAFEAQNKVVETLVVSIDGKSENILQEFLALRREDGEALLKELDKIQNEWEEKKTT
jgi:hypothetical protein